MPTANELATAAEAQNPDLIRNALVKRVIYVLDDSEDPQDFTANVSGTVPLAIALQDTRTIFWLQGDDNSSTHDGVSVIVTDDGYRYHATDFQWPTRVLAVAQNDPPADSPGPDAGDAYHVGSSPTGDWVGHPGEIAVWTARGWVFMEPRTGQLFYNEDDGLHYFLSENGTFGTITLIPGSASVKDTALIGGQRFYIVENQTTDDPPGASDSPVTPPSIGVYYIVGSSPNGDWSGHSGEIATSYDAETWTFITPVEGMYAHDKALNTLYRFEPGNGWLSASSSYAARKSSVANAIANLTPVAGTGTGYTFSATTAPTSTQQHSAPDTGIEIEHAALSSGRIIEVEYSAALSLRYSSSPVPVSVVIGLFRDAESNAIDWMLAAGGTLSESEPYPVQALFVVSAPDASTHTYKVRICPAADSGGSSPDIFNVSRRRMVLREGV